MKKLKGYVCENCRKLTFGICPICHNEKSKYPFPYNPIGLESRKPSNRKVNNETRH